MVSEADQRRRRRKKKKKKGWMGQVRNGSSIRKETEGKTVVRSGRDEMCAMAGKETRKDNVRSPTAIQKSVVRNFHKFQ